MTGRVAFHRADVRDAEALGRVHSQAWRAAYRGLIPEDYLDGFTPEKRAAFFTRLLPATPNENYLIRVDDRDAGMLAFGPAQGGPEGAAELQALYLLPDYWGKGVGLAAMGFAAQRLRGQGYTRVLLWVLDGNARARRFYERYGFAREGAPKPITLGAELTESRYGLTLLPTPEE